MKHSHVLHQIKVNKPKWLKKSKQYINKKKKEVFRYFNNQHNAVEILNECHDHNNNNNNNICKINEKIKKKSNNNIRMQENY